MHGDRGGHGRRVVGPLGAVRLNVRRVCDWVLVVDRGAELGLFLGTGMMIIVALQ